MQIMKLYLILSTCKRGCTGLYLGEGERNSVDVRSLETSKVRLGRALSSLVELKMSLLMQGFGR